MILLLPLYTCFATLLTNRLCEALVGCALSRLRSMFGIQVPRGGCGILGNVMRPHGLSKVERMHICIDPFYFEVRSCNSYLITGKISSPTGIRELFPIGEHLAWNSPGNC